MEVLKWKEIIDKQYRDPPFIIDPYVTKGGITLLFGDTSIGKCISDDTRVLLASGYPIKAGDLTTRDKLMGPGGKVRQILGLHKGKSQLYRIQPTRGESWECTGNHILSLQRIYKRKRGGAPFYRVSSPEIVNVSVAEYMTWGKQKRRAHQLYRSPSVEFPTRVQVGDAYLLGLFLGDGHLSEANLELSTGDQEIREYVTSRLQCTAHGKFGLRPTGDDRVELIGQLRTLGLVNTRSGNKFIPPALKLSTKEARLRLLAGLIDTDGFVGKNGIEVSSKSKQLATDVAYVARSLGMGATVSKSLKFCQTGGGGLYYRVYIYGAIGDIPLRIHRKKLALAKIRHTRGDALRTTFKVIPSRVSAYTGIELDGDQLHLLEDFTVVHNSPVTWEMARAVGAGTTFFGLPTKKGRVLYIEVDTPEVVVAPRLKEVKDPPEDVWFAFIPSGLSLPAISKEEKEFIYKLSNEIRPDMVVLNTLRKLHDEDDRESKVPKMVYSTFQRFFPGAGIVVVHHSRKTPTDPRIQENDKERFSGSKHWLNDAQVGLYLAPWKSKHENLRLYHVKTQASELLNPLPLLLHKDGTTLTSPRFDELSAIYELVAGGEIEAGRVDRAIVERFGVSLSTAKRRRLEVEAGLFPGSRRFLSSIEIDEDE